MLDTSYSKRHVPFTIHEIRLCFGENCRPDFVLQENPALPCEKNGEHKSLRNTQSSVSDTLEVWKYHFHNFTSLLSVFVPEIQFSSIP